jgi:hypothetical protein
MRSKVPPFLISEFGLDYRQIGTLVGLFMLPGLALALPGGRGSELVRLSG